VLASGSTPSSRSQFTGIAAMSLHEMQRLALPIDARPGPSDGGYR
jgi:hypothetical protein